jgi:hypothetical protein
MNRNKPEILRSAIAAIMGELINGSSDRGGWVLNPRDVGLLRSLDHISAEEASKVPFNGTSSIAAHIDHLRYGLSLLNQASVGENPFADADWSEAWNTIHVSDAEWVHLREDLAEEARKWEQNFETLVEVGELELTGVLASAAHLAYHLGAIRQISPSTRGPAEGN